jgi:hypothetical protein
MSETETKDPDMTDDELVERLYDIARMRAADGTWFGANGGTPEHTTEWLAAERITRLRSLSTTVDLGLTPEARANAIIMRDNDARRLYGVNYDKVGSLGKDIADTIREAVSEAIRSRGPSREGEKDLVQTAVQGNGSVIDPAWQLVPKEPTQAMLEAAVRRQGGWLTAYVAPRESGVPVDSDMSQEEADYLNRQSCEDAALDYRAMLSASPTPPEETCAPISYRWLLKEPVGAEDWHYGDWPTADAAKRFAWNAVGHRTERADFEAAFVIEPLYVSPPAPREVTLLKEENDRLKEALLPFAMARDDFHQGGDMVPVQITVLNGDIHNARAALSSTASGGENG